MTQIATGGLVVPKKLGTNCYLVYEIKAYYKSVFDYYASSDDESYIMI